MTPLNRFSRALFTLILLLGLLIGMMGPLLIPVKAAPQRQAATNVIISEFRTRGSNGGNDEFVELYNPISNVAIDISGWELWAWNSSSGTTKKATIPSIPLMQPGQHYLIINNNASSPYDDGVPGDLSYASGIADNGGIALIQPSVPLPTIIDQVGLNASSVYIEGTALNSFSSSNNIDQSYERNYDLSNNCIDANNNASDFFLRNPSDPQNSFSTIPTCGDPAALLTATASAANLTGTAGVPLTGTAAMNLTGTALNLTGTAMNLTATASAANLTGTAGAPLTGTAAANLTGTATGWTPTPTGLLPTATPTITNTPTITLTPTVTTPFISEVAWAGTKASPNDEWIELYNPGAIDIVLTNWQIVAKDGLPLIPLSGTIPARGFYLIYRSLANVVSDVPANLVYGFDPLSVDGETLYLKNASRTIIDSANKSGTAWPAGQTGGNYPTMERAKTNGQIAPDGPFAWVTNNGTPRNGHDADGHDIYGTPGRPNWPISITMTPTRTVTPTGTIATPTKTGTPTPTTTPTLDIIINEVAWMGTIGLHDDEWIELYNPTDSEVDLNDWKIKSTDNNPSIVLTGKIPAKGYYIIAPVGTFEAVVINQTENFDLSDTGKSLQLISSATAIHPNTVVDTANSKNGGGWSAGFICPSTTVTPAPEPAVNTCASMERHSTGWSDSDWYTFAGTGTVYDRYHHLVRGTPGSANWAASVTATPTKALTATLRPPTARASNAPPIVATLVINEFLPRADFDWNKDGKVDVFDEFIEIANLGPINANLSGWKLDDMANGGSTPFTLPSMTLKPGEHALFYASQTNVLLSDGGDTVRLLNPNNVIKDAHTYSLVKIADQSTCRLPDINGSWYSDCFPTPNQRNSRTGTVPSAPAGTGLEELLCLLPDTLPEDFRLAECFGFGSNMWNSIYWEGDRSVRQNGSKWDTFVQ